ncbi:dihydroorotate dehydrogenase electron transfer subunit [bacterium]|nr:dihydroorotate dehydrogenase electron transfer subunit [bacterium]
MEQINLPIAEKGVVDQIRKISDDTWDIKVFSPGIAKSSKAAQFVHVRVSEDFRPFLRRPLSVGPCSGDYLRLIFTVKGSGTRLLAQKSTGDVIDLIGPLGNPFKLPEDDEYPIIVGGGIGVVPLLLLDDQLEPDTPRDFLLGVRTESLLPVDEPEIKHRNIQIASDDGSIGFGGNVVQLLERKLSKLQSNRVVVYACGPGMMMYALKQVCIKHSIKAYISLEVPMGCGLGACQSCAVPRSDGDGYLLVCQDGPVFDATEVLIEPEVLR